MAVVRLGEDLASREAVIERGLATFVEVGNALLAIREDRQYLEAGFPNFEAYCQRRWQMTDGRARQLMRGADVMGMIRRGYDAASAGTSVPVPQSEAVARELVPAPDPVSAWATTVERHGSKPTAAQVREVVRQAEPYLPAREKDEKGRPLDVDYVHADSADLNLRVIAFRHLVEQADRLLEPRDRADLMINLDLARHSLNDIEQILRPAGLRIVDGGGA